MKTLAAALVLLVLVGFGCAPTEVNRTPPSADVTGLWSGTWRTGSNSGPVVIRFQQTGSKVVGEQTLTGLPHLSGAVEGSIVGNQLSYHMLNRPGGGEVSINGDEMRGYGTATGSRLMLQRQK